MMDVDDALDGVDAVYIDGYEHHGADMLSMYTVARPEYSPEYLDALARFNASLARDDCSPRARATVDPVLAECGAHYTAWRHRARCVEHLVETSTSDADARAVLEEEFVYVDAKTASAPKNYQVWNHARVVIGAFDRAYDYVVKDRALAHVNGALAMDGKNIHAWTHRAWCVERFQAWDEELEYTAAVLREDDWMNNSAWNARFHAVEVACRRYASGDVKAVVEREVAFVRESMSAASDNESAWNYLRGLNVLASETSASDNVIDGLAKISLELARDLAYAKPPNRHAALFVADVLAADAMRDVDTNLAADAIATFSALMTIDPVRTNYYVARIDRLQCALNSAS